ncbi:Thiamine-monophosphate kinase [hydrothermal vent metagenome]|uniref:Thiamine-monophosphate kinase n=1 Tax=hydrothermal vent metagenome TaxID=652676 RepID=A0A3B0S0L9_9ZZZZ
MSADEFSFISELARFAGQSEESLDLADDGALIGKLVLVKDLVQAGIHALPDDNDADVVRKAIRVNLSDLAAMAAQPKFILLGLCLGTKSKPGQMPALAETIRKECEHFAVHLIGGDTVQGSGPTTVSITAIGEVKHSPVLRSGGQIGDNVWVSGSIGDGALGLKWLQMGQQNPELSKLDAKDTDYLAQRYRWPQPRIALGYQLASLAHCMIDISDGLAADAGHLARASNLSLVIETEKIPVSAAFQNWRNRNGSPAEQWKTLSAGDDYELLFSAPMEARREIEVVAAKTGCPVTRIGHLEAGNGVVLRLNGAVVDWPVSGFTHF